MHTRSDLISPLIAFPSSSPRYRVSQPVPKCRAFRALSREKYPRERDDVYFPRIPPRWNVFNVERFCKIPGFRVWACLSLFLSLSLSLSIGNVTTVHHVTDMVHESERYFRCELSLMNRNYCAICSAIITRSLSRPFHSPIDFHRKFTDNLHNLYVNASPGKWADEADLHQNCL